MPAWLLDLRLDERPGGLTVLIEGLDADSRRQAARLPLDLADHGAVLDFHAELARRFDLRPPEAAADITRAPVPSVRAVLTENLGPGMLYGYGDPAVTRVETDGGGVRWWLCVTSNDAPDAFPILSSDDLETWCLESFAFPRGQTPPWALTGPGADFWGPELHQVGGRFWLCFTARTAGEELAIGLAVAASPSGPFEAAEQPLLRGGVIDPHIVLDPDGAPHLVWKEDANDRWPRIVARLLRQAPGHGSRLFPDARDLRTAELCSELLALHPGAAPMEAFFILQPLIEAAADDFPEFRRRLSAFADDPELDRELRSLARAALEAARTVIRAQRLSPDGSALVGDSRVILENDQPWEAHLIEGPWISRIGPEYGLFYAGNDFSTGRYGIGVALAANALGPYRKPTEPLLGSTSAWIAPGHPSVTTDADGRPRMFMHGFRPGQVGYKAFRALLTAPITWRDGQVRLGG